MTPGYHLLQFVPDPFTETAITFGALVEANGTWHFEAAGPGERLLPAALPAAATTLFRALVAELQSLTSPRLPISLGPHVRLRPRVDLPAGVGDAAGWVVSSVLPNSALLEKRGARRQQRTRRTTLGKLFLREHKVFRYVKPYFKAEMVGARAHSMKPISQYVLGGHETMLLEPVYLDADNFEKELQEVTGTLFAWDSLAHQRKQQNLNFSVYAIGSSRTNLAFLSEALSDSRITIVDTSLPAERQRFVAGIRALSESTGALHS